MRRTACLLMLLFVSTAFAQDESLVGKVIIAKEFGVELTDVDDKGKTQVVGQLTDSINYRVLEQKGNQVKVKTSKGAVGWFDKSYALLPSKAIEHFSNELAKNPNDAGAFQRRSYAYEHQGDLDAALKDINETIRLSFFDMAGWNSRGILYCERKEYDKAITDLSLAIRFAPNLASAYCNRGYTWMMKKEYDKAMIDLNTAIFFEPLQSHAYNNRGLVCFLKKDYKQAHVDFDLAEKLDPGNPHVYMNRARLYATSADANQRDGKRAMAWARRALELANDPQPIFLETLAAAYAEAGLFADAVRTQEQLLTDPRMKENAPAQHRLDLYRKKLAFREE